jgi:phosphoribosyl-ATP pyrophosphohydrolase/phosphoribosyl-AMP cyclohydrolase
MKIELKDLKFDERGLIPTIVQDARTREVLMLAYMNAESVEKTLATKETWFWSRSRAALWHKGETSGNTQRVVEMRVDCDADTLVALVEPAGAACHTGARTCFYREFESASTSREVDLGTLLTQLYSLIETRHTERPENSYTSYLFNEGLDKILKKIGEESAETIIAAKNEDAHALAAEVSDLIYHLMVLLVDKGIELNNVRDELTRRGLGKRLSNEHQSNGTSTDSQFRS